MYRHHFPLARELIRMNRMFHSGMVSGLWVHGPRFCEPCDEKEDTDGEPEAEGPTYVRPHFQGELNEEKDGLTFSVDLPGVQKKDLELEATRSQIELKAVSDERAYKVRVPLRYKIDPSTAKANLRSGVLTLEVALEHPLEEKPITIDIK